MNVASVELSKSAADASFSFTNPFATRFTRPGAIAFLFEDGVSAESLVKKLREQNWWGQITGDHGSGKSTLLATLLPALEAAGRNVVFVTLRQEERRLPPQDVGSWSASTQLVIDGYEQLSWWSRWRVKALCCRSGAGLLVTSHADVGLPTVFRTQPTAELARVIVAKLLKDCAGQISQAEVAAAYEASGGSVRETLFRLYDVYQAKAARAPM